MPHLLFLIDTAIDGNPAPAYSAGRSVTPTERSEGRIVQPTGGGFTLLAAGGVSPIRYLYIETDVAIAVSYNGDDVHAISLAAGGVILKIGCSFTTVAISNSSGVNATVDYLLAG